MTPSLPTSKTKAFRVTLAVGLALLFVFVLILFWARRDDPSFEFEQIYTGEEPSPETTRLLKQLIEIPRPDFGFDEFDDSILSTEIDFEEQLAYLIKFREAVDLRWKLAEELEPTLIELVQTESKPQVQLSRITDLPDGSYSKLRYLAKLTAWNSILLANDGEPDRALLSLHNFTTIANNGIEGSVSIIESLSWTACGNICLIASAEILEHYTVSQGTLLDGLVKTKPNWVLYDVLNRNMYSEIEFMLEAIEPMQSQSFLGIPLVLPKATANAIHRSHQLQLELVKQDLDLETMKQRVSEEEEKRPLFSVRNFAGNQLARIYRIDFTNFIGIYHSNLELAEKYQSLLVKARAELDPGAK